MLDIQLLRKDLDGVAQRLADRGYTLDIAASPRSKRNAARSRPVPKSQARRNSLSKQIGAMKGRARTRRP